MKLAKVPLVLITASILCSCKATEPTPISARPAASAGGYDECHSETPEAAAQRAPSFLSQEQVCLARDTQPALGLVQQAGEGHITEKGDCAFAPSGISCHYHTGQEFLTDPSSHEEEGVGELHCIVPAKEATRPVVYGAHIRCKPQTAAAPAEAHGEEDHTCKSDLMEVFSHCSSWRCCDNGTLTNPIATQSSEQRAVHPDFRICADEALEIDCSLLTHLHGHEANAPVLGGTVKPVFEPGAH